MSQCSIVWQGKRLDDAIHYSRNVETVRCIAWHSYGSANVKSLNCFSVNVKTRQRNGKVFHDSTGDYEGTAARKPHSNRSGKRKNFHICC